MSLPPKKKVCKGKREAKDFESCGEFRYLKKYNLCSTCLYEFLYFTGQGKELLHNKILTKAKKDVKKKEKNKTKDLKLKLKKLSEYKNEAKTSFQRWVRKRDEKEGCISCGSNNANGYDGGHFYKSEIYSGLIFDERNCRKQCRKCNRFLGGNENNYRLGLIKKFGEDYVLDLDKDALKLRQYKYNKEELIDIKKIYDEKYKELNK